MKQFMLRVVLIMIISLSFSTIWLAGCGDSSSDADSTDGDLEQDSSDAASDGDFEQTDGDSSESEDGDADESEAELEEGPEPECEFNQDCELRNECIDGLCVMAKRCKNGSECNEDQMCVKENADEMFGGCFYYCMTDMDCSDNAQCIEGQCTLYVPMVAGPEVNPDGEKGKLRAGFARGFLDLPMSVSIAGYGYREAAKGPYQSMLGGAGGMRDRLEARALTLDDGKDRIVLLRLPMVFVTDYLFSGIIERVIEMGGPDLRDNLVLSASHSHSGPGRHWNLLPGNSLSLLGADEFNWEIYDRIATSSAKVVLEAQSDLEPAAFGYEIMRDFDPDDRINKDRRPENDDFKDPNLMLWRVDKLKGGSPQPWVMLMSFAIHGTIEDYQSQYLTGDAPAGVEISCQRLWEKENEQPIETMFLQGNAGDVQPAGYEMDQVHSAHMEKVGIRVYNTIKDTFNSIVTSDEVDLGIMSKRVAIDRDYIGYSDDQFYSDGVSKWELVDEGPIRFGALECGVMNKPLEQNLELALFDGEGQMLEESTTTSDDERVIFTPETSGTYYVKVWGDNGGMLEGYTLLANVSSKRRTEEDEARCIDALCGKPCGMCKKNKALSPADCSDDTFDDGASTNDTLDKAVAVDLASDYNNLAVCPWNEDWFKVDLEAGTEYRIEIQFVMDGEAYNPETQLQDGNLACIGDMDYLVGHPVHQFSKSHMNAFYLDDLLVGTMPGETTSHYGVDTEKLIEEQTGFENAIMLGCVNDYHFYITPEDDWFQGGYNTESTIWGFKFAEFLQNELIDMAKALDSGDVENEVLEYANVKPTLFFDLEHNVRVPEVNELPTDASFTDQPDAAYVKMNQRAKATWRGCDPGVDAPIVYLEVKDGEQWLDYELPGGRTYDDRDFEIRIDHENEFWQTPGDPEADKNNYWKATWEERVEFPVGIYRFRVEGQCYSGSADKFDKSATSAYIIRSQQFELLPTPIEVRDLAADSAKLTGTLRYPPPEGKDKGDNEFEGAYSYALLYHGLGGEDQEQVIGPRPPANSDFISVALSYKDGESFVPISTAVTLGEDTKPVAYVNARDAEGIETFESTPPRKVTTFEIAHGLSAGTYTFKFEVADSYGNAANSEFELNVPAK